MDMTAMGFLLDGIRHHAQANHLGHCLFARTSTPTFLLLQQQLVLCSTLNHCYVVIHIRH